VKSGVCDTPSTVEGSRDRDSSQCKCCRHKVPGGTGTYPEADESTQGHVSSPLSPHPLGGIASHLLSLFVFSPLSLTSTGLANSDLEQKLNVSRKFVAQRPDSLGLCNDFTPKVTLHSSHLIRRTIVK
jgi:hypothetical protein